MATMTAAEADRLELIAADALARAKTAKEEFRVAFRASRPFSPEAKATYEAARKATRAAWGEAHEAEEAAALAAYKIGRI